MRKLIRRRKRGAFTHYDLLVAGVIIIICIAVLVPSVHARTKVRATRVKCMSNLKQISLAMMLWSIEHGSNYPMRVSWTNGGSKELTAAGWVTPTFWSISNELSNVKIALCPADKERLPPGASFSSLRDGKISYFLALEGALRVGESLLLGDRNVATNGLALRPGVAVLNDPAEANWTKSIHGPGGGNIALADGSAHQVTDKGLRDQLKIAVANSVVIP
jgi:hypothetical protein